MVLLTWPTQNIVILFITLILCGSLFYIVLPEFRLLSHPGMWKWSYYPFDQSVNILCSVWISFSSPSIPINPGSPPTSSRFRTWGSRGPAILPGLRAVFAPSSPWKRSKKFEKVRADRAVRPTYVSGSKKASHLATLPVSASSVCRRDPLYVRLHTSIVAGSTSNFRKCERDSKCKQIFFTWGNISTYVFKYSKGQLRILVVFSAPFVTYVQCTRWKIQVPATVRAFRHFLVVTYALPLLRASIQIFFYVRIGKRA